MKPTTKSDKRKQQIYTALPQIIAVSIKNVLLLGYGMTLGFPTIVIPTLQGGQPNETLILTPEEISWISSINLICVPLGCLLSGIVTQPLGRKKSMQLVNIPFFAAWLIFHYSAKVEHLYAALCITGLAGGLLEAPVLTYVAEITQPHLRGMLSATSSMTIIFGVFCQFLLGTFLYWRTVALVNLTFPILAVILLFLIPESPHWLVLKNRLVEAKQSLAWLRGWTTIDAIDDEFKTLCATLGKTPNNDTNGYDNPAFIGDQTVREPAKIIPSAMSKNKMEMMKRFATKSFLFPYCLICLAFFLGHFSGMTTLQTFAVQIFQTFRSPIDKYYATLLLGIVELIGSLISVVSVHYIGKRPLTFISTIGCGFCFLIVATYAHFIHVERLVTISLVHANSTVFSANSTVFGANSTVFSANLTAFNSNLTNAIPESKTIDVNTWQWLPTSILIFSALLSHVGIRLLPWVLIGECFPTELRGIASGLAGGMGYIFGFAANKVFLTMINNMTLPGTYWFYGCVSLTGTLILYFFLPETEGRTLHDIELHFAGLGKIDKRAGVYKKPKFPQSVTSGANVTSAMEIGEINHGYVKNNQFDENAHIDSKL